VGELVYPGWPQPRSWRRLIDRSNKVRARHTPGKRSFAVRTRSHKNIQSFMNISYRKWLIENRLASLFRLMLG